MKLRGNAFLVFCFTLCLLFSVGMLSYAQSSDIGGHWAEKEISKWLEKEYAQVYPDGTFKPDKNITRVELVTWINKSFGFSKAVPINFKDVSPTDGFYEEIAKGVAAGYLSGYEDGTMRPNSEISRQEITSILSRLLSLKGAGDSKVLSRFVDAGIIYDMFKPSVSVVVDKGIMKGYPDQTFRPLSLMTRAEALVVLDRALGIKTGGGVVGGGGGGGHHGGGDSTAPRITAATVTINGVNVKDVTIHANGLTGEIDLGKSPYNPLDQITAGSIRISEDATLVLTFPIPPFDRTRPDDGKKLTITQDLKSGGNNLDVIDYLDGLDPAKNGVTLQTCIDDFGNEVTFNGTLTDKSGNVSNVSLTVKFSNAAP